LFKETNAHEKKSKKNQKKFGGLKSVIVPLRSQNERGSEKKFSETH
jgi:hypothetical protein